MLKYSNAMQYIPCKTIVAKTKNHYWFGTDHNMNIYRGCCHGCIYCDSRSDCYREVDFDTVKAKENALEVIKSDLSKLRRKGVVATGSMSDPYNPFESGLNLTGKALMLLDAFRFGVAIATKSPLITRDIDLLQSIKEHSPVICKITITTSDDVLSKKIERSAAPSSERFAALSKLSQNSIFCGVLMMPILPFINDTEENIVGITRATAASGAKFIMPSFGMTLRDSQRAYYYEQLDKYFPAIKAKYIRAFNDYYQANSPNSKKLYSIFASECQKHKLLFEMQDIIKAYKSPHEIEPLDLFDLLNNRDI